MNTNRVSASLKNAEQEFNTGGNIGLVVSNQNKKPIYKWKNPEGTEVLKNYYDELFWKRLDIEKIGIGVHSGENDWIVLDWDQIDEYNLKVLEYVVVNMPGVIFYPTRNGAHTWFKKPVNFNELEKWTKRQTGLTSMVGNEKIDYLPNGIINFGLMSKKTGMFEAFWDVENFGPGELQADVVNIIVRNNLKLRALTLENLEALPLLPKILYPLGKTDRNMLDLGASRNVGLTSWVNKINFYSRHLETEDLIEPVKQVINTFFLDYDPLTQEELNAITVYKNESLTNPFYMTKADEKVKKVAVKTGKEYNADFTTNFGDIAATKKTHTNDIVDWIIKNLEVKLYDKVVLFKKWDKWQTNPNILMSEVNRLKREDHLTTAQLQEIYKKLVWDLETKIAAGDKSWRVNINKKPLWIDVNGKQIDPYDVWNEDGTLKIQEGLEDGVVIYNMDIDFEQVAKIPARYKAGELNAEWDQYVRYIMNPVKQEAVRVNHVLSTLGYMLMAGSKFRKEIMMVYSVDADSGKSKLLEMLGSYYPDDFSRAKLNEMSSAHGLEPLMNKALNIGDDIDGNSKVNTEIAKTLASEMFAQANPKGLPATSAIMPKLAFSMNALPTAKNVDHGWIRRMNVIHWEKNYEVADFQIERNIIKKQFRELVFFQILVRYNDIKDVNFWNNPYPELIEDYLEDAAEFNEQMFANTIAKMTTLELDGKTWSEVVHEAYIKSAMSFKEDRINAKIVAKYLKPKGMGQKRPSGGKRVWKM